MGKRNVLASMAVFQKQKNIKISEIIQEKTNINNKIAEIEAINKCIDIITEQNDDNQNVIYSDSKNALDLLINNKVIL